MQRAHAAEVSGTLSAFSESPDRLLYVGNRIEFESAFSDRRIMKLKRETIRQLLNSTSLVSLVGFLFRKISLVATHSLMLISEINAEP